MAKNCRCTPSSSQQLQPLPSSNRRSPSLLDHPPPQRNRTTNHPEQAQPTQPEPSTQEPQTEPKSPAPSRQSTTAPAPAVIKGFVFSGNTVIGNEQLQTVTQPFVGEVLDLPVLEKAAQSVTDYYRKQGYTLALAYVPQQQIELGVVTLALLEGRIGDVTVNGNRHYSTAFIKRHFAQAEAEPVARNESLERGLLLLNEYPSLKTSATLEPGNPLGPRMSM